jgi:hypothetical protein
MDCVGRDAEYRGNRARTAKYSRAVADALAQKASGEKSRNETREANEHRKQCLPDAVVLQAMEKLRSYFVANGKKEE